ncbi:MAG: type II/IV secretion system protein [Armatimonadetes bacterium]|nr:type II/IV secretion system protein [Armatimonadota bacterium]
MSLQEQAGQENVLKAEESALVELSRKIVEAAIAEGASDIHIDPGLEKTRVRFRNDGVMSDILSLPKNVHAPLVTRFKMMAELDTSSQTGIQFGRLPAREEGRDYELKVTTLPTLDGEKVTFRILTSGGLARIDQMGYRDADRARIEKCMGSPCGLIVYSGPTGSGKTTGMYAALLELIKPSYAVMTVEDPVEFRFPGAAQVSVNRKAGILFPDALNGVWRSDPDIVLVGDLPDRETAEQCLKLAITGHLVITQIQSGDAAFAVHRLLDIGLDPFTLSSALLMVSSQRLVRRICPKCKEEAAYSAERLSHWRALAEAGGLSWPESPRFFKGKGCDRCRGTGYFRRMGVYEIMAMDQELASLVSNRTSDKELQEAAVRKGMTTMLADGIIKALDGQTTVEEVTRVLGI